MDDTRGTRGGIHDPMINECYWVTAGARRFLAFETYPTEESKLNQMIGRIWYSGDPTIPTEFDLRVCLHAIILARHLKFNMSAAERASPEAVAKAKEECGSEDFYTFTMGCIFNLEIWGLVRRSIAESRSSVDESGDDYQPPPRFIAWVGVRWPRIGQFLLNRWQHLAT